MQVPSGVKIHVHVADDGSPSGYQVALLSALPPGTVYSYSDSQRRGYGANYNLALQTVHNLPNVKWVLPLEDDWELIRPLDVSPILQALDHVSIPSPGCVRMGYVGYTQPLRGEFIKVDDYFYIKLDPASEEPHVFAGHPRLEGVDWQKWVGPWPEGLQPGATEWEVAHKENARQGVWWPVDLIKPTGDAFVHIGTERSY